MKKILFLLIFLSSFSFSATSGDVIFFNGSYYKLTSQSGIYGEIYRTDGSSIASINKDYNYCSSGGGFVRYDSPYMLTCGTIVHLDGTPEGYRLELQRWNFSPVSSCPTGQTLGQNGICSAPDPLDCKKVDGQYSNLDGTCTDCSNFLSDSTVDGMANCACGAVGSSYNGQSFLGTTTFNENGYKYSQSEAKCADGTRTYVYYGKIPLDNNNSDNNSTSPDNNSTKPSDGNTTTPSDGNGTKDGNSTAPSDGNGTGSGKDYTKYLETIVDQLKNIGEDTDNLGGINNGINGQFPTISSEHNIPTDTSSSDWSNYAEAWDNIMRSVDEVGNGVSELQGLISNGFSSPFLKSSPTTCPYTTSFEFGDVGSIPISFDLCKVFSPLRSIFYTFSYLFFVFGIIYFHVKMFLRLV